MPYPVAAVRGKNFGASIRYLLRDEFTTDRAAGAVHGTAAEPGPGTRVVVDTESKLTIASGALTFAGGKAVPSTGDPGLWHGAFARNAGRAFIAEFNKADTGFVRVGWDTDQSVLPGAAGAVLTDGLKVVSGGSDYSSFLASISTGTSYKLAIILLAVGAHYVIKGGAYTEWTYLGRWGTDVNATVYPCFADRNSAITSSFIRVADLPAPWNTDYGVSTQRLAGARSAGDTFTHEANCILDFRVTTLPAADQIEFRFRVQDATNYWQVTVDSTGAIDLDEVVAGVVTQRGTAAGVIANGDYIEITAAGQTIKVYEGTTVTDNLRITYALAANFATKTDGELETVGTGGAVTDIVSWPRTLSGSALSALNKVSQ